MARLYARTARFTANSFSGVCDVSINRLAARHQNIEYQTANSHLNQRTLRQDTNRAKTELQELKMASAHQHKYCPLGASPVEDETIDQHNCLELLSARLTRRRQKIDNLERSKAAPCREVAKEPLNLHRTALELIKAQRGNNVIADLRHQSMTWHKSSAS